MLANIRFNYFHKFNNYDIRISKKIIWLRTIMEKYNTLKQLGDGTFGSVLLATVKHSGEQVAIKKYKNVFKLSFGLGNCYL